jgi:hypothetical protein
MALPITLATGQLRLIDGVQVSVKTRRNDASERMSSIPRFSGGRQRQAPCMDATRQVNISFGFRVLR